MQQQELDKNLIQSLVIPFSEVMPAGSLRLLRLENNVSETTPRKVLTGEWTNAPLALAALRIIVQQEDLIRRFLLQFPQDTVTDLRIKQQLD